MQTGINLKGIPEIVGMEKLQDRQTDIVNATIWDVKHDQFAGMERLWVNVNGICVLRVVGEQSHFDLPRIERLEQAMALARSDLDYAVSLASEHDRQRSDLIQRRIKVIDRILKEGAR